MNKTVLHSKRIVGPNREYFGTVEIKHNPRWCSVRWDVGTLDLLCGLSDYWLCKDNQFGKVEEQFGKLRQALRNQDNSREAFMSASLRWGTVKGVTKESAMSMANAIINWWNGVIETWFQKDEESKELCLLVEP